MPGASSGATPGSRARYSIVARPWTTSAAAAAGDAGSVAAGPIDSTAPAARSAARPASSVSARKRVSASGAALI